MSSRRILHPVPLGRSIASIARRHCLSLFFALAGTIIAAARLTQYPGWGDDWAAYVEQGIAIATGTIPQQQLDMRFCIDNSSIPLGPYAYPWGLPLAIAGLFLKTGFSMVAFKAINLLFWGPFLFMFHVAALRRTNRTIASILTALFIVHPIFLGNVNAIGSDIPFLFLSFSSVLALESLVSYPGRRLGTLGVLSGLGGIACSLAFLFRTNGVVVLASLACTQLSFCAARLLPDFKFSRFVRDAVQLNGPVWIQSFPLLSFAACILLLKSTLTIGGDGHLAMLSAVSLRSIAGHSLHYTKVAADWLALPMLSRALVPGVGIVLLSAGAGLVLSRAKPMEVLFVLGTALCYIIWPAKQDFRFLFPLVPFILLWIGEIAMQSAKSRPRVVRTVAAFAIVILANFFLRTSQSIRRSVIPPCDDPLATEATNAFAFIRRNTPDDVVVAFRKPRALHLLTGRRAYAPHLDDTRMSSNDLLLIDKLHDPSDWIRDMEREISSGSYAVLFENKQFLLLYPSFDG